MDVRIRPASQADLPVLVRLLGELFSLEADFTPDAERQRFGLALMLSDRRHRIVLVAERGGEVIGMVTGQLVVSTAEGGLSALLEDLIVAAGARGGGGGRKLVAAPGVRAAEGGGAEPALLVQVDEDLGVVAARERVPPDEGRPELTTVVYRAGEDGVHRAPLVRGRGVLGAGHAQAGEPEHAPAGVHAHPGAGWERNARPAGERDDRRGRTPVGCHRPASRTTIETSPCTTEMR